MLGVVGNILIIITVLKRKSFSSPTNTFLANLAITDLLLILICVPIKLITLFTFVWPLDWVMCKLVFYLQDVSTICSVLNLVAISVERFYAIVYPLQAKTSCTVTQAKKIILTTWIFSILLAVPRLIIMVRRTSKKHFCEQNSFDRY